jgi:lipopolysaccharide biosynthesis protein
MSDTTWRRRLRIPPGVIRYQYVAVPIPELANSRPAFTRIGVFLHAYYEHEIQRILPYLANIGMPFDLYVSTDAPAKQAYLEATLRPLYGDALFVGVFENRGRDIAPKFVGFRDQQREYDLVLHIHAKKSTHTSELASWLEFILKCLLGSPEICRSILALFANHPQLGVVAPRIHPSSVYGVQWGKNYCKTVYLARQMGVELQRATRLDFPAGSMFWARPAALRPLLDLDLTFSSFEPEHGQLDGTTAHAIERLIFYSAKRAGFRSLHVGAWGDPEPFETVIGAQDIEQVWAKTQ